MSKESSGLTDTPANPVDPPSDEPNKKGLTLGRMVNGAILLLYFAAFMTALVIIGLVGSLVNDIKNYKQVNGDPPLSSNSTRIGYCPFYSGTAEDPQEKKIAELSSTGVCLWFIAGQAIIAITFIVLGVLTVIRIIMASNISFFTIIEIVIGFLLLILAFAVAVSISIGKATTCNTLTDKGGPAKNCESIAFPNGHGNCPVKVEGSFLVCWWSRTVQAEAAAWIIHIFIVVFIIVSFVRLFIKFKRRKEENRRSLLASYDENAPSSV